MARLEYDCKLFINNRKITKVIIDQHYKEKHSEKVDDELILELLRGINDEFFPPISKDEDFEYFKAEPVYLEDEPYRLIFLLYVQEDTLGVINCFRVPRRLYDK